MKGRFCICGLAALLASVASAHHSTRVFYDYDDDIEIVGEITWVLWRNPHVRFNLLSRDDSGNDEVWELEAGSVNTLDRVGIAEGTLQVGDAVRVAGPPSRHGLNSIYVSNVLFEDGREVSLQGNQRLRWTDQPPQAVVSVTEGDAAQDGSAGDAEGIFRVWVRDYGGDIDTLPFRPAAIAAREAWDPLVEDPGLRCIPPGMPVAMDNPYPIAFMQDGGSIILRLEEWDGVRTIHMDGAAAAADRARTPMGFSAGHWEGNTLVVSTRRIDYPYFDSSGSPQGPDVEIVERFSLSDDERRLDYEATVIDDATFTGPAVLTMHWDWDPAEEIKLYECTLAQ